MLTFAIIGAGAGVFRHHRAALQKLPGQIVGLVDIDPSIAEPRARELDCALYTDYQTMLRELRPAVAVILTPTFLHASIAISCLRSGCHVLVEKPMAIQVAEADEMIETAAQCQRMLGVVFQQRFRPEVIAAKALLEDGQLGEIQHVELLACCPRPSAYYRAVSWRGTWAGEGGGVVMNQAPHHLDMLCHLIGKPSRVFAWTRRIMHTIETEDTVQAQLEWPNGALGSFCASTAFAGSDASEPVAEQDTIKILGTAGSLLLQNGELIYARLDKEFRQFVFSERLQPFPVAHRVTVPLPPVSGNHLAVYRNFCAALLQKSELLVTGEEARQSLELANAFLSSGMTSQVVELPLDRDCYARLFETVSRCKQRSPVDLAAALP